MMYKNILLLLINVILINLLINIFSSCTSSNHNRRGSLSDAMDKASDESEDREVETETNPDFYFEDEFEEEDYVTNFTSDDTLSARESSYQSEFGSSSFWMSVRGGTGLLKGKDFFGLNHIGLALGGYLEEQHRFELDAGFALAPLQQTSVLNQSLDGGVALLNLGLNYKWFTTPEHTFLGQYFSFGLKYNYMLWSYKNPILADYYDDFGNYAGTEEISNDGLSGFEFYSGIGFHVLQVKGFQIGTEFSPGVIFWVWETTEGFENDVFSTFWYVKFTVLINFGIN